MISVKYDKNKKELIEQDMYNILNLNEAQWEFIKNNKMKFKLEYNYQKGRYYFWCGNQIKHSDIQMIKVYYIRLYDSNDNKIFSVNFNRSEAVIKKLDKLINAK